MRLLDLMIVIGYMLLMLAVGYFSGKKNKDTEDYFLAGRSMPWIPIALSIAATMISANGFIGGPGWAYTAGMYPFMVNIAVPLAIFVAMYVTTPVLYFLKVSSVYEYMELRLGMKSRALTIAQFYVNSLIQVSSMVFITVLIVQSMTGWRMEVLVPIVVFISIAYTIMGGIRAVIWTDAIQMVVVIGGVVLGIIIAIQGIGLSFFDTLQLAKESGKLNTLDFRASLTVTNTFWATLFGGTIMWIRYFCFDQTQVQRVLTSKSLRNAKNSFVISAFVMSLVYYLMLFIGVLLFFFYKGKPFDTSNEIMIGFIMEEMPVGIIGLFVAGILAAAMSSIDSILNSMAAVFTKDIYERHLAKNGEKATIKTSMLFTVAIGGIMTLFILFGFSGSTKSIVDVVGKYISYFAGPAAGAFLLAMFTLKANDHGVSIGFLLGLVLGYIVAITAHTSWLLNPLIGAAITVFTGYIFSALRPSDNASKECFTAMGLRRYILSHHPDYDVKSLPFAWGKQEIIVLSFFVLQYVFLFALQYR